MRNKLAYCVSLMTLSMVLASCGKKAAVVAIEDTDRGSSGGSTPRGSGTSGDSGSLPSTPTTQLTCTTPIVMDDPGEKLAAFFGKTYVPTSGTGSPQSIEEERVVIQNGWQSNPPLAKTVYDVESLGYCLKITGTGLQTKASLTVEYEDAIALSWYTASESNFLTSKETGNTLSLYWFDAAGFVRLSGDLQADGLYHAELRYVNFPTTAQVKNQLEQRYRATTLNDAQCLSKDSTGTWIKSAVDCVSQRLLSFNFFGLNLDPASLAFSRLTQYPANTDIVFNDSHKARWAEMLDLYMTDAQATDFGKLLITPGYLGSMKFNRASVTTN